MYRVRIKFRNEERMVYSEEDLKIDDTIKFNGELCNVISTYNEEDGFLKTNNE